MEITKKFIIKNIDQALLNNDYELVEQELFFLEKVLEKHFDDMAVWTFADYHAFAEMVCEENIKYALRQFDLIDQSDLNLPSEVIINLEEYDVDVDEDDIEDFICKYLDENYDYCIYDFEYKIKENKKSVLVSNIDWDY